MGLRDLIVVAIVLPGALVALRRPWIGVLLWTWLSLMSPHRYTWGIAYSAPLAAIAAGGTLLGLLLTRERESPFKGTPVVWFLLLSVWITISWFFGLDRTGEYAQWDKIMKINLMIFVALALLRTKTHILVLTWVVVGSVALLGIKGGFFTLITGGGTRVWGPPGSFIHDNNEFGLAVTMIIPLLRFLQMQYPPGWQRHGFSVAMILCAIAVLGTHSRGGLVAILTMSFFLWLRSGRWFLGAAVLVMCGAMLIAFMPENWTARMATMEEGYQSDFSAWNRISAWWNAYGIAKDYPLGVGFNQDRQWLFDLYSPYPERTAGPHSIYFQILGNHGFIGLIFFLGVMFGTYRMGGKLQKIAGNSADAQWCVNLGKMCQVALIGYFVGGAFLALGYYDLPYNIMVIVVLATIWVCQKKAAEENASPVGRYWERWLGLLSNGYPR